MKTYLEDGFRLRQVALRILLGLRHSLEASAARATARFDRLWISFWAPIIKGKKVVA